jgi:acyl-CoA synthetase (AMP-forming)/AMP-acid ligase II
VHRVSEVILTCFLVFNGAHVMLQGYLAASGDGGSAVPAEAAARFVMLPAAVVLPLLPGHRSRKVTEPARSVGCGRPEQSLLLGEGAAAWLRAECSTSAPAAVSRVSDDSDGSGSGGVRFFRTGDLGHVDAGGGLLMLGGRRDLQVKVRGVHVQLSTAECWTA